MNERRRSAPFLRRGLVATLLPLVALALVFGYVDETRVYLEALPFLTLILAPTLVEALAAGHGDQA